MKGFLVSVATIRRTLGWVAAVLASIALAPGLAFGVSGAGFTTVNELVDGSGHCKNGNPAVNCNIYDGKQYVWLNGGPAVAYVGDGTYFFAVLAPGGQANANDGTSKNLSDDFDAYTNRTFTVTGGTISYGGSHDFANNKIRLMPYADTPNPGGEYVMAICSLGPDGTSYPVDPSTCKYDAFKIQPPGTATVRACKFEDQDGNGLLGATEPLLSKWTIMGTGVLTDSGDTGSKNLITDESGCVDFTVKNLNGPVTLQEQEQDGWIQTAPNGSGTYVGYTGDDAGMATVKVPLNAGDVVTVYFGNYNNLEGGAVSAVKTAVPHGSYAWAIAKSVDKTQLNIAAGGQATFHYTVDVTRTKGDTWQVSGDINIANSLGVTLHGVKVTENIDNGGICTITAPAGTPGNPTTDADGNLVGLTIPAGIEAKDLQLSYVCTFDPGTVDATTKGTNEISLSIDGTEIAFDQEPYNFDGNVDNQKVTVSDPNDSNSPHANVSDSTSFHYDWSTPGVAGTCTKSTNTATIEETKQSASKDVTVCVGSDLTVSKDATPTFTRSYAWSISKSVDQTVVKLESGNATFNYTVSASETGFTDSAWAVSGTITVTNPNDWEAITVDLTDAFANATCTVTNGTSVVVPASSSVQRSYSCSVSSGDAFTNTATATWDKAAAFTPGNTATGTKAGSFTTPTSTVNRTVHVTDSFAGALGSLTATDSTPYASASYSYPRTVAVPSFDCKSYDNTATITETGQTSSQTVKACGPAKTGALTMGFWQNNNGQGIIKAGASTAGVCNATTWLRLYAPFQDLSSTASCSSLATYAYNLIKAANASGAAMNAMLKAQMLATALDAYFSDPGLGGNKIGAPAPVGGVAIDLTLINKPIGSNTFENTSSAFGGATSLTVAQILAYAASQSNAGGTTWYGQVKATQELAKDTFDAINNQKAFAP